MVTLRARTEDGNESKDARNEDQAGLQQQQQQQQQQHDVSAAAFPRPVPAVAAVSGSAARAGVVAARRNGLERWRSTAVATKESRKPRVRGDDGG